MSARANGIAANADPIPLSQGEIASQVAGQVGSECLKAACIAYFNREAKRTRTDMATAGARILSGVAA